MERTSRSTIFIFDNLREDWNTWKKEITK
jgi:hypothetical protein